MEMALAEFRKDRNRSKDQSVAKIVISSPRQAAT
jgi:hypothetical protein